MQNEIKWVKASDIKNHDVMHSCLDMENMENLLRYVKKLEHGYK